jgi:hypothetical protein
MSFRRRNFTRIARRAQSIACCVALVSASAFAQTTNAPDAASPASPGGASPAAGSAPATGMPPATDATAKGVQAASPANSLADTWLNDRFFLETSIYNEHFHYDPAHVSNSKLLLGEWNITPQWLVGVSFFRNSFDQQSEYVYGGWRVRPFDDGLWHPLYFKISAGVVHGYKGQYRDKIPFNHSGYAPVIIPSIGYCVWRVCPEVVIVGGAGLMFNLGVTLP